MDADIGIGISANDHGNTQCRQHEHTERYTHFCALIDERQAKLSDLICSCFLGFETDLSLFSWTQQKLWLGESIAFEISFLVMCHTS